MNTSGTRKGLQGFTMIEILVTILVFGIGVLGLAALSAKSQQIAGKAYQQMQASWKAQELIESMRSNPDGTYVGITNPASHGCMSISGVTANSCSENDLAEEELWLWSRSLEQVLPSPNSWAVTSSGTVITVTISWDSDRSGTADTSSALEFEL